MARFTSLELGHLFIFSLVGFNIIVLCMNFAAVSKHQGFRKLQNVWKTGDVNSQGKTVRQERTKISRWENHRDEQNRNIKWSDIKDKHKSLPAQNKMRATLSSLREYTSSFLRQARLLQMEDDMFRYKSVTNEGDVGKLNRLIADVMMTNKTIHIGVIGGSQSSASLCDANNCLYIELVVSWLRTVLGVNVILHNAALPLASSAYFSWCLHPHLDASKMDIIIWELSVEDFLFKELLTKNRYTNPGQLQEELTRRLLSLPNDPYIIYFNFLSVEDMKNRDCLNSEHISGKILARHYNITNISWGTAVCSRISRRTGFMTNELIHADQLLSKTTHQQASLFMINFFKKKIEKVALTEFQKAQTDERYIRGLIKLHDVFLRNSKASNKAAETSLRRTYNSKQSTSLPNPRWTAKWLTQSQCWPASTPQFVPDSKLSFPKNGGWETIFSDRENWYTSTGSTQILEFPLQIERKLNQTAIISIVTVVCGYCGQALVFLDGDVKKSKLLYGTWSTHAFRIDEIFEKIDPGDHTLFISSLEEKPYKLAAVMVGYRTLDDMEKNETTSFKIVKDKL